MQIGAEGQSLVIYAAIGQTDPPSRPALHDEGLGDVLITLGNAHVYFIGGNVCAHAPAQEAPSHRHLPIDLVCGLVSCESGDRLQESQTSRLCCGRLNPVRVQERLPQHLISRADTYDRRPTTPCGQNMLGQVLSAKPVQVRHSGLASGYDHQVGAAKLFCPFHVAHTDTRLPPNWVEVVEVGDMRQAHDCNVHHRFIVADWVWSQAQRVLLGNVYV